MSLVFCDGFEQYSTTTSLFTDFSGAVSDLNSTYGWVAPGTFAGTLIADSVSYRTTQTGIAKSLKVTSNSLVGRLPPSSQPTLIFGFAFKIPTLSTIGIFGISDNPTYSFNKGLRFRVLSSGAVDFFNVSTNSAIVTSATGLITTNTWYYVELKINLGVVGSVEARINESSVCSASLVDTLCGCVTTPFMHLLGYGGIVYFDDFYICDGNGTACNDFLGAINIFSLFPNGAGATNSFPNMTGATSHTEAVSDQTQNTSSYISSSTSGQKELFVYQSLPSSPTVFYGVQVNANLRYSTIGTVLDQKLGVRSSSTNESFGSTKAGVFGSWIRVSQIFELDADSNTWSLATINAIQAGIKNN